jgi:glutaredoxin
MNADSERTQVPCCPPEGEPARRRVVIDFLFLDLSVCPRCRETDRTLERAVSKVRRLLSETGTEVIVNKIHVQSEDQARELGFVSSPTIRVNGRDLQPQVRESRCEACATLSGAACDCRVWVYGGREFAALPEGMMIDAVLAALYGSRGEEVAGPVTPVDKLPDNLRRFFAGKARGRQRAAPAGSPAATEP